MQLVAELDELATWVKRLPSLGMQTLGGAGASMYILDFVMIGAVKRSLSLASGMLSMVQAQNMVCSRAILRMQLDTVSCLLAYTYVKDPEAMAKALIGGTTSAAQLTALGQELLTFKGESSRLTSDITGAARLHRAAPALMDGLAVFWDE